MVATDTTDTTDATDPYIRCISHLMIEFYPLLTL